MTIRCEIVSQDRKVFEGDVDIVVLPGADGEMGILPHHAPLLTTLKFGVITVRTKTDEQNFTVAGGMAEVQPQIVTVLADAAENVAEIDTVRAESARQRAQEALANLDKSGGDMDAYLDLEAALRRSNLRLDAAKRFRTARRSTVASEE
ncbi:MAG: ATP synthase F1 subunit epsilon [Anaerolineae bacterium CG_4_9_14_3_um_filter_57_17]|nr:ATP synthase F1 subunit epsilon [bacterium]NCT19894.1 ATP synthase F1 subunit epsilon [bacterium]OIO83418.1 MAG: ATP synthase F1 subunit epsilon [Anaerolineae bacterium CG2_30_57_67]PJB68705.1 MAG: ATP synthase F1 subunit epsilon [Anaerolineae bacterium CG_4_9_14_3_um_filter_57_17]